MNRFLFKFLLSGMILFICFIPRNDAADEDQKTEIGGVTAYGVIHNIAEDRKIEQIGGTYEPEGLDKYMKRKFDELGARLDQMNHRIQNIETKISNLSTEVHTISIASNKSSEDSQDSKEKVTVPIKQPPKGL